jgi:hypothetical protein
MLIEHLIYSTALAIFAGMIHYRYFGRDYSWIIIASAYIPDLDMISDFLLKKIGITVQIYGYPIAHGHFHNLAILTLYAVSIAFLLHPIGFRFVDSIFFAGIGFSAHLFEDALVFKENYPFFWPLVPQHIGIGLFHYDPNLYGFADQEVLMVGLILLFVSIILRTAIEGTSWAANYLPTSGAISSLKEH